MSIPQRGQGKLNPTYPKRIVQTTSGPFYQSLNISRQRQSKAEEKLKQNEVKNKNRKPVMKPTPLPPCPVLPSYPNTRKLDPKKGVEKKQIFAPLLPMFLETQIQPVTEKTSEIN